jgi:hypothetical protein
MDTIGIPVEIGVFTDKPPDEYVVITPMADVFEDFADDEPHFETQEVRISLFSKGNYQKRKNQIVKALLTAGITVTGRRYLGHEDDSQFHHYGIDVSKVYQWDDSAT